MQLIEKNSKKKIIVRNYKIYFLKTQRSKKESRWKLENIYISCKYLRPYDNKNAIHPTCGIYLKWHLKGHCSLKCYIRKEEKWEIKELSLQTFGQKTTGQIWRKERKIYNKTRKVNKLETKTYHRRQGKPKADYLKRTIKQTQQENQLTPTLQTG